MQPGITTGDGLEDGLNLRTGPLHKHCSVIGLDWSKDDPDLRKHEPGSCPPSSFKDSPDLRKHKHCTVVALNEHALMAWTFSFFVSHELGNGTVTWGHWSKGPWLTLLSVAEVGAVS